MPQSSAVLSCLRGARMLRGVEEPTLELLAQAASRVTEREGELLWQAGQEAQSFTIIQRGLVQIRRRSGSGTPAVIAVFGPTESIGDIAVLERAKYPAEALCVTDVEVVKLPAALVLTTKERSPALAHALQTSLLEHTHALMTKIDIVSAGTVTARLAKLLLHLYERFGDETEEGGAEVPIPLSRSGLANLVSARSETVIRALSALRKSGLLEPSEKGFVIRDIAELKKLAHE